MRVSDHALDHLFDSLEMALRDLPMLKLQVADALETERRCGSTMPDGFHNHASTEGAAIARAMGEYPLDRARQRTLQAIKAVESAVIELQRARVLVRQANYRPEPV
jgi:hypothetical protein